MKVPDIYELLPIAAASLGVVPFGSNEDVSWQQQVLHRAKALRDAMALDAATEAEKKAKRDVEGGGRGGAMPPASPHPQQPIIVDERDVVRFKPNRIVKWMLEQGRLEKGFDLNAIAAKDFPAEDRIQLAQLLGYSVSGFGSLPYVPDELAAECDRQATEIIRGAPEVRAEKAAGTTTGSATLPGAIRAALSILTVRDPDGLPVTGRVEHAAEILRAALEGEAKPSAPPCGDTSGPPEVRCELARGHAGRHAGAGWTWGSVEPSVAPAEPAEVAQQDGAPFGAKAVDDLLRDAQRDLGDDPPSLASAYNRIAKARDLLDSTPRPAPDLERIAREEAERAVIPSGSACFIRADLSRLFSTAAHGDAEDVLRDIILRALRRAFEEPSR